MDFGAIFIIPVQNSLVEKAQWSSLTYYLSNHGQLTLSLGILVADGHKLVCCSFLQGVWSMSVRLQYW